MRNVIGGEDLVTYEQTNELAYTLLTECTRSVMKALWLTISLEGTMHYATLPGGIV